MNNRLSCSDILKKNESYYSLVVAIAKRARQISEEAEEKGEIITVKPVQLAIDEFVKGQYKLIEKENIGQEIE